MHIRIFEPDSSPDRWTYWVVFFPDSGKPQVYNAVTVEEAEQRAGRWWG